MKKEQRDIYINLGDEIDAPLCTFCRYAEFVSDGCCEGYAECHHPIEALSYQAIHEEDVEPGTDCFGFKAGLSVQLVADLVGEILTQGYREWFYRKYSPKSVTVYGTKPYTGETGKVRIGRASRGKGVNMKEEVVMCQYRNCNKPAKYAIYKLNPDGTKVWMHYCSDHEKETARENYYLRRTNKNMVFIDKVMG
jgi:hypothetical protein